ncbi:MAG: site-specific integrase, partial [Alphaproteobacteria bacterium]
KVMNGEKLFSITAEELRNLYLKSVDEKVLLRQVSKGRATNIKTYTKHYINFVGKTRRIQNIPTKEFREYLGFRRKAKDDILVTVVRNESSSIKQLYRFAIDQGLMPSNYVPDFGTFKIPNNEATRDAYTITEYRQLVRFSKQWWKDKSVETEEEKYHRRLINDFIVLMFNGGFRTSELLLLKWKDIKGFSIVNDIPHAEVTIRAENSKVKKERHIEVRRGDVFQRIKEYSRYNESDDFVFSRYNQKALIAKKTLYETYNELKQAVKVKHPEFDTGKDIYALRHLFISMRILAGFNVYDLAKVCGTSLTQIQKHYDAVQSLVTSKKLNKTALSFDSQGNLIGIDDD